MKSVMTSDGWKARVFSKAIWPSVAVSTRHPQRVRRTSHPFSDGRSSSAMSTCGPSDRGGGASSLSSHARAYQRVDHEPHGGLSTYAPPRHPPASRAARRAIGSAASNSPVSRASRVRSCRRSSLTSRLRLIWRSLSTPPAIATMLSKAITTLSVVVPSRGDPCLGPGRVSGWGSGKWRRQHTAKRRAASIPWPHLRPRNVHRRCQTPRSPRQHWSETVATAGGESERPGLFERTDPASKSTARR